MTSGLKQYVVGAVAGTLIGAAAFGVSKLQGVHPLGGWPIAVAFAALIAMCAVRLYAGWQVDRRYGRLLDEREARGVECDLWSALRHEEAQVAARIRVERRRPRAGRT